MAVDGETPQDVDWSALEERRRLLTRRTLGFLASLATVGAAFAYDLRRVPTGESLVLEWDVAAIDWLFLVALLVTAFYVVGPLVARPALARTYWRRLRRTRRAVAATAYLGLFFVVGTIGPAALDLLRRYTGITGAQGPYGVMSLQPPLGATVSTSLTGGNCVGKITRTQCHGTIYHPLGTTRTGQDVLVAVVEGAQVALEVSLVVAVIVAPIGIAVGTAAAYYGGWVDELLMRYVDIQLVIPPFFVYLLLVVFIPPGFMLMILVFGLLNWGSIARTVRSEALSETERGYVAAARDAGSGPLRTVRRHLVPNVSNSAVTAVTLLMPWMILIEVTLAYLNVSSDRLTSWGNMLAGSAFRTGSAGTYVGSIFEYNLWWIDAFPILFLALTVVAFNVFGDELRDVLDPETEAER